MHIFTYMQQKTDKKTGKPAKAAPQGTPEVLAAAERIEALLERCAAVLERLVGAK